MIGSARRLRDAARCGAGSLGSGLIAVLTVASLTQPVGPLSQPSRYIAGQSEARRDSVDDGPYVLWHDAGRATVFHLCKGELSRRDLHARSDTLSFRGLCGDSATYRVPLDPHDPKPHEFSDVDRVFAVSDIHGEYRALIDLLRGAGIIDDDLSWAWGDGHLVVNGDVFDRGDRVTECLWLIHRLEREAEEAGGRVHYLLGNHEVMVMRGDLRYVNEKYVDGIVRHSDIEYEDLFGPDMELGRWLRGKNGAVKIDSVLYVHGGLSPRALQLGLDLADVNAGIRRLIDARSYLIAFDDTLNFLLGSEGPLWYRGYHEAMEGRYAMASEGDVLRVLDRYGARAIVVGHTEIPRVEPLQGGRVFAIDVPVKELGGLQGLLWTSGRFYRVDTNGARTPLEH